MKTKRPTDAKRSDIMKSIKCKDSQLEINFRKIFYNLGFRYRKNSNKLFGKPDIYNSKKKIVIFIDSCFWHGCKKHCRMPKSNIEYWINKINRNIKRDKKVNKYYKKNNWNIIRFWEHEIEDINKVQNKLNLIFTNDKK